MTDREFVLDTFLGKNIKVASVNLCTGEYAFVKASDTLAEQESMTAETIDEYFRNLIDREQIYPDDIASCRYHMDLAFLRERIFTHHDKVVNNFRYKAGENYIWVTLEIITPVDVSEENPWVVYCWSESDQDAYIMEDGVKRISGIYERVLKINLTTNSYMELAKDGSDETPPTRRTSSKASRLLRRLARSGDIHRGDVKEYLEFTDIDDLKTIFSESREPIRLRYRQKVGEVFHWFSMEFVPSVEYTEEDQIVMLYMKDIHDEYIIETNHHRRLAYYANFDTMTGVWNHEYFYKRCQKYNESEERYPTAILYTNINGMRELNRTKGIEEGNRFIRSFVELLAGEFGKNSCYRMSGDEFLVLFEHESEKSVRNQIIDFRGKLKDQKLPVASLGYAWSDAPVTLEELLSEAENKMFQEKQIYYRRANIKKDIIYKVHL